MWGSKGEKKRGREKNMGYKNTGTQKQGLKKKKKRTYISPHVFEEAVLRTHAPGLLGALFFGKQMFKEKSC